MLRLFTQFGSSPLASRRSGSFAAQEATHVDTVLASCKVHTYITTTKIEPRLCASRPQTDDSSSQHSNGPDLQLDLMR